MFCNAVNTRNVAVWGAEAPAKTSQQRERFRAATTTPCSEILLGPYLIFLLHLSLIDLAKYDFDSGIWLRRCVAKPIEMKKYIWSNKLYRYANSE